MESTTRRYRPAALRLLGYLAFSLLTHTYVLHSPIQCDSSLYLRFAHDWANGATLYADRYEAKTPVMFGLFRLIDTANPRMAFYLLEAGLIAVAAWELRRALVGPAPQAAPIVPILLIAWSAAAGYDHPYGQFVIPFAAITTAWLGLAVWIGSTVVYPVLAGVMFALMIGVFPPAALTAASFLPFFVWNVRRNGRRSAWLGVGGFLLGVVGVTALVAAHAWWHGYWAAMVDALTANRRYAAMDRVTFTQHLELWEFQASRLALALGSLAGFAVVASLLALASRFRQLPAGVRVWAVAGVVWLLAVQVGAFAGGRHFSHYYLPLVAPLALLGGLGTAAIPESIRLRSVHHILIAALVVSSILYSVATHYRSMIGCYRRSPDHPRTWIRNVSYYLNHQIPKDEPVLVCTWGIWAELYWQAPKPSPSRHIVPFNLAETRPEFFAEWAEDVLQHPPEWVVVDESLMGPSVTDAMIREHARGFGGEALTATPAFDRLRAMLRDDYVVENGAPGLLILRRRAEAKHRGLKP